MGMFKDVLFPHERPNWSDKDGRTRMTKDSVKLPPDWKWQTEWVVEVDPNFHDNKGWTYAKDFQGPFSRERGMLDFVRRRKWIRFAQREQDQSDITSAHHRSMSESKKDR